MSTALKAQPPVPPEETASIEVAKPAHSLSLAGTLLQIAADTGTPYFQLIREFAGLAFGPGKLSFEEYVALRLFDPKMYEGADKKAFVGLAASRWIWLQANHRIEYFGLLDNKIAADALFAAYGFSTIPTLAIFSEQLGRPATALLHSAEELSAFLTRGEIYPLFGKPIDGRQSLGSASLDRYDAGRRCLVTAGGREIPLDAFITDLRQHYAGGYLFQKRVSPHAAVRAICGDHLATVRLLTIWVEGEPRLLRACWKIPGGSNAADNFWRPGNLLAQVDVETGRIGRAMRGTGMKLEELTHHPDTGAALVGSEVPNWRAVAETALEGARLLKHVALIGWDIAPVDGGAMLVELNQTPDFLLPQLADRRGILDTAFSAFLAERKRDAAAWKREKKQSVRQDSRPAYHLGFDENPPA